MLTLTSPRETWLHAIPAGAKLLALLVITVTLFQVGNPLVLAVAVLAIFALYAGLGIDMLRAGLSFLRPLLVFIVVVGLWHVLTGDLENGAAIILRFIAAVAAANLVTMTTRLTDMIAVVEAIVPSIPAIGLNPRRVALAMALAIRFIPVLSEKITQARHAWMARSARRPRWNILVPVILAVLDDAEHVADAIAARGGSAGLTHNNGD